MTCLVADPVFRSLLSYSETGAAMLLLVSSWLNAISRRNPESKASAEYNLSGVFGLVFAFGFHASIALFLRPDTSQTRWLLARFAAAFLPSFMLYLLYRFSRLLREHRKAVEALRDHRKSIDAHENRHKKMESGALEDTLKLMRSASNTEAAVRYLIERYALDNANSQASKGETEDEKSGRRALCQKWPLRSQWQLVVWTRQCLLFFISFIMKSSVSQAQSVSRYIFASLAVIILASFWTLHYIRQPYALRVQQRLESFLFAVDVLAVVFACLYGYLTGDGQREEASGRQELEIGLGALLILSVVVAIFFVMRGMARERKDIVQMKKGWVQGSNGEWVAARDNIDNPVGNAIADGAIKIISCSWLVDDGRELDTPRELGSLPRTTVVTAHLSIPPSSRIHEKSINPVTMNKELIALLSKECKVSPVCITVEESSSLPSPPASSPPSPRFDAPLPSPPHTNSDPAKRLTVRFHLSTFQEVSPLTRARLRSKAMDVQNILLRKRDEHDELAKWLRLAEVKWEEGQPFLPRCQDMPPEAFLAPERAAKLFDDHKRRSASKARFEPSRPFHLPQRPSTPADCLLVRFTTASPCAQLLLANGWAARSRWSRSL